MSRQSASARYQSLPIFVILILFCLATLGFLFIPFQAQRVYGPPSPSLGLWGTFSYSVRLLWYDGLVTSPRDAYGLEQSFHIDQGESIGSIAGRLEQAGLISSAGAFSNYLIYTGLDTSVQAGDYQLGPALSVVDIAHRLQDATPEDVTFVVLPGWRMEEIAASLPTSGLNVTPQDFLALASTAPSGYDFFTTSATAEGFLYPDSYILPRTTTAQQLLETLVRNFALHMTGDLRDGFSHQGLNTYQAVTLASLVQREAIHEEEQPIIASVFFNRLKSNMQLDSDPTVQYALGYNALQQTWWTNPLSLDDLQVASPYNTYTNLGLPPGPIDNPGLSALRAVAFPADTQYYYFRARCDDSGYHSFAETFDQHLANACP